MEDNCQTIQVIKNYNAVTLTIDRVEHNNSINSVLMKEINEVLTLVEKDEEVKVLILEGKEGFFCTGMDFKEIAGNSSGSREDIEKSNSIYSNTLKRFACSSKIIVSKVDGQANAGGIGLIAASDYVLSSTRSIFSLSEALFGLLPANVIPYLIRRVGFQKAYSMTLTTQQVTGANGYQMGLVDELTDNLEDSLRKFLLRVTRLKETTIKDLKNYFRKMWIITEEIEQTAIQQITDLMCNKENISAIKNFVDNNIFPWEK